MTIYLYVIQHEGHTKIKHIHRFASEYLRSWFPKPGSYQAFNNRLNRLTGAFNRLVEILLTSSIPDDCILEQSILDSLAGFGNTINSFGVSECNNLCPISLI
jgi:hypothetical protein